MRNLTFSIYSDKRARFSAPTTRSWNEWIEVFGRHDLRTEKDGPAFVAGTIPENVPRGAASVVSVDALTLDLEHMTDEKLGEVLEKIQAVEWFAYTTHSSKPGETRLRVVLPLKSSLTPKDFADSWARLNSLTGFANDPQTKDICRLNFLPSTPDPLLAATHHNPGEWLDPLTLPEARTNTPVKRQGFDDIEQSLAIDKLLLSIRAIPKVHPLKEAFTQLLAAEPFAGEGKRHEAIVALTMWIAQKTRKLSPESIESIFLPSFQHWPSCLEHINQVSEAYQGAVVKLEALDEKIQAERQTLTREKQAEAFGAPYSQEDLERIATRTGCSVAELRTRWVLQRNGSCWFLMPDGEYSRIVSKEDVPMAFATYLSRAPVRLVELTQHGQRTRPISDVIRESGSLVERVITDLSAQVSTFDATSRTFCEAITPIRKEIAAKYDPQIDEWLKLLGGDSYGKLVDWMAISTDLTKLVCAIYFDGAAASGKSLFAFGMSKLWTDGPPADILSILSDFNDELIRCPLIVADEDIPTCNRRSATATLRTLLSTTSRTLRRKYLPNSECRGAVRLVLTANNEFLLETKGVSSAQDLEAIAQRFLYIPVDDAAVEYLNKIPRQVKEDWGNFAIAGHALWLSQNHTIAHPGKRFYVEGDISMMHRLLMTGSFWNSLVCEWLVKYLLAPHLYDIHKTGFIQREHGELYVNDQAISEGWNVFLKTKQDCETAKVGAALEAISKSKTRIQKRYKTKRIRYRVIDVAHLLVWSDRYNIGDREAILRALENKENVVEFNPPHHKQETVPLPIDTTDFGTY